MVYFNHINDGGTTMNKNVNLNQLLKNMSRIDNVKYRSLNELIEIQHKVFEMFFRKVYVLHEEVSLEFENRNDAITFYMDCHFGSKLLRKVGVFYDLLNENKLILKPILNVIDLIDSRTPGLCELSSKLNLNFKMSYQQSFSNTTLELYIHRGEIVEPQCIIRLNETIPYLALGQLMTLIRNEVDFNRLNTRIELVESESLYESSIISH